MRRRLLLLQIRDQPEAERQERACFIDACGVAVEELEAINVVASPRLTWSQVRHADALLVGGAGEHSATRDYDFSGPLGEAVSRWLDERRPFFGSCFGHHFVARLLGGEVITDRSREEIGSFDVELTPEGRADRLFTGLPPKLTVQLGHHDRVSVLPPGSHSLAHSERCPHQAIGLSGDLAYTTQFHPELSRDDIRSRLMMYREGYLDVNVDADASRDGDSLDRSIDRILRPSPLAPRLLRRFVDLL